MATSLWTGSTRRVEEDPATANPTDPLPALTSAMSAASALNADDTLATVFAAFAVTVSRHIYDLDPVVVLARAGGAPRAIAVHCVPTVTFTELRGEVAAALDDPSAAWEPDGSEPRLHWRDAKARAEGRAPDADADGDAGALRPAMDLTISWGAHEVQVTMELPQASGDGQLARAVCARFTRVLEAALTDPSRPLEKLEMLDTQGREAAVGRRQGPRRPFPDCTLHDAVFSHAAPDDTAVRTEGGDLTFGELELAASALASALRERGVTVGDRVGLCMDRSPELLSAMLAAGMLGAAFVPVDPSGPAVRHGAIWRDAGVEFVICEAHRRDELADGGFRPLVPPERGDAASRPPDHWHSDPATPLYVIFTSGSTGEPKGVLCSHRSVVSALHDPDYMTLDSQTVFAQGASPGFDACIFEAFAALLHGGSVAVAPSDVMLSARRLAAFCRRHGVTHVWLTSGLFSQLSATRVPLFRRLDHLLIGGEAVNDLAIRSVLEHDAPRRLTNGYGQTEYPFLTCCHDLSLAERTPSGPPIGRPTTNTRLDVLDVHGNLAPANAVGELAVSGPGLSYGYLNRPELTRERFVPRSAGEVDSPLIYKTGDLVRDRGDGVLEYVGRVDDQVKIRGFRVEPGEITATLLRTGLVADAATVVREGRRKTLLSYVVQGDGGRTADLGETLRARLAERLPSYMVPARILLVREIPLTANGKVDQTSLLAIQPAEPTDRVRELPATATERWLAGVWRELLDSEESVARDDDFFGLGGDSLGAMELLWRIEFHRGVSLPLSDVFEDARLRVLAAAIEDGKRGDVLEPARSSAGKIGLTPAQQSMWFVMQLLDDVGQYNQGQGFWLEGELRYEALETAFNAVVHRHDALRMRLVEEAGRPLQAVADTPRLTLHVEGSPGRGGDDEEARGWLSAESRRPFDLSDPPHLRVALRQVSRRRTLMAVTMHHIFADGWSLRVVLEEVGIVYNATVAGRDPVLPPLPAQYGDFADWLSQRLMEPSVKRQGDYWRRQLAAAPACMTLPPDRRRYALSQRPGAVESFTLPADIISAVQSLARARRTTPFVIFLAAFAGTLALAADEEDVVVAIASSARADGRFARTVGLLLNTLAIRIRVSPKLQFAELMDKTAEAVTRGIENGELPYAQVVQAVAPKRDVTYNPIAQVGFQARPQYAAGLDLDGIEVEHELPRDCSAQFDLLVDVTIGEAATAYTLTYDSRLYTAETIKTFGHRYRRALQQLAGDETRSLESLDASEFSPTGRSLEHSGAGRRR